MIKKRFLSMLVLLMTAVTGAWAGEVPPLITIESTGDNASFRSGSKTFDDKVTVTFSGDVGNDNDNWGWYTYSESGITLTVTAAEGYTITGVKFTNNSGSAFDASAPFEAILIYDGGVVTKVNGTSLGQLGVTKIEVYGYAGTPATVAVTGVTLLPTTATLTVGETETLTATVLPGDATDKSVTWSSSNEAVATVSNEGVVTAVAAGEATITVTATNGTDVTTDDQTATCTVTVTAPAASTYTVSLKEGTEDATSWQGKAGSGEYQALPLEGVAAGTAVTVKYDGRKRVRSVKAVKKGNPLTMEALTDGTIVVNLMNVGGARRYDFIDDFSESRKRAPGRRGSSNISMKYSVNGGDKITIYEETETTTIDVVAGDKVQFYGDVTSTQFHGDEPKVVLQGTAETKVYGNIMSLLDEDNYATLTTLPDGSFANFAGLFYMNENLTDASGLLLPATTLTGACYYGMFAGCTSLTTAPALPATELAEQCYFMMFFGCTSLTTAPALPATELAVGCYYGMFQGCTSLTTAPALPATELAGSCYYGMFDGCTSLTTAPALPATTLTGECYYEMFYGCTSLNSVTCMATDISASDCTTGWLDGVASTGTFTKASGATWPEGANGIPDGWTVNEQ